MGQRLHIIRKDQYRLNISAFDNEEYQSIISGDSKNNYSFSIKEKLKDNPLDFYEATVENNKLGFSINTSVSYGTYLYVISLINLKKKITQDLAFGYIEVHPDV